MVTLSGKDKVSEDGDRGKTDLRGDSGSTEGSPLRGARKRKSTDSKTPQGQTRRKASRKETLTVSEPRSGERSSKRNRTKFSCGVEGCNNTDKTVNTETGEPLQFFEPPNDRKLKLRWDEAIPELTYLLPNQRHVCEQHFADGRPTDDNPIPELNLKIEVPQVQRTPVEVLERKRAAKKAEQMESSKAELFSANLSALLPQDPASAAGTATTKEELEDTVPNPNAEPKRIKILSGIKATGSPGAKTGRVVRLLTANSGLGSEGQPKPQLRIIGSSVSSALPQMSSIRKPIERQESQSHTHNYVKSGERVTCDSCTAEFPRLRNTLGKMESRLDSMISMVKTIFHQQFGQFPVIPAASFMEGFADSPSNHVRRQTARGGRRGGGPPALTRIPNQAVGRQSFSAESDVEKKSEAAETVAPEARVMDIEIPETKLGSDQSLDGEQKPKPKLKILVTKGGSGLAGLPTDGSTFRTKGGQVVRKISGIPPERLKELLAQKAAAAGGPKPVPVGDVKKEVEEDKEKRNAGKKHYLRNAIARCLLTEKGNEVEIEHLRQNSKQLWLQKAPIEQINRIMQSLAKDGLMVEVETGGAEGGGRWRKRAPAEVEGDEWLTRALESYGLTYPLYLKSFS